MKPTTYKNYSNTFVFDTGIEGLTITIFGGIHGNETAGVEVVNTLVKDIESEKIKILKGKLVLAYGNERAIEIGKRDYKYNLNRLFKEKYFELESEDYEIKRVKELKDILDNSDILLDIHSVSSDSEPFMFAENIDSQIEIAKVICYDNIIVGWSEAGGDLLGGDTDGYMHSLGKISYTFECGNHYHREAFTKGLEATMRLFVHFGLLKSEENYTHTLDKGNVIEMYKIQTTETGNFEFLNEIHNFGLISKGELIGKDGDKEIYAEEDFLILLPNYEDTKIGDEVFYYGRKK